MSERAARPFGRFSHNFWLLTLPRFLFGSISLQLSFLSSIFESELKWFLLKLYFSFCGSLRLHLRLHLSFSILKLKVLKMFFLITFGSTQSWSSIEGKSILIVITINSEQNLIDKLFIYILNELKSFVEVCDSHLKLIRVHSELPDYDMAHIVLYGRRICIRSGETPTAISLRFGV